MAMFKKKPVSIEAITFDELVEHGKASGGNIVNGMPWSFQYKDHPITHENDDCYLIPTLEGVMKLQRGDMLITGIKGEIYPCKGDIFAATYDSAEVAESFQDRVRAESAELNDRLTKLQAFLNGAIFSALPEAEQRRLIAQAGVMAVYHRILLDRIAAF